MSRFKAGDTVTILSLPSQVAEASTEHKVIYTTATGCWLTGLTYRGEPDDEWGWCVSDSRLQLAE